MQDGVIPLFSHDRRRKSERRGGWSNQDLAELYRIEAALVQAGISVDTEMGETDEGDPWFAFCRSDTCDVLVHVAIIDGEYHIAGTTTSVIVKGYSFTDIVRQFMTREPAFMLGTARHNNVMIHPSSVLIAVFAAICLISDEQNASLFGFGDNEKSANANENRQDAEIFNVADNRQIVLGDFTFTPQQVFIILSAIAFSSSPIIQNNSLGLETAFGVFDLIETGGSEAEKTVELAATDVQEESYLPAEEENTASKEYAQILSDRQLERSEAKAEAKDAEIAVLLKKSAADDVSVVAGEEGYVEPEARDMAYVEGSVAESEPVEETQTVAAEQEPLIQTPVAESNDVAVAPVATNWVVDFFTSNAEFADAGEEISSLIDSLEADLSGLATDKVETVSVSAESDLPLLNGSIGDDATLTFPPPVATQPVEMPDFGIDVGNASNGNLSELAFLFSTFEETFGDALIDDSHDRYVVHNDAAWDVAYDDNAPELAILRFELDDGTPVYFMGLPSDFEYQMV